MEQARLSRKGAGEALERRGKAGEAKQARGMRGDSTKFSISIIFPFRAQKSKMNARAGKLDWLNIRIVAKK